jgi:hypothetical protein
VSYFIKLELHWRVLCLNNLEPEFLLKYPTDKRN